MIPFSPPYITEEAIREVVDTLKSGWITTGPKTKKFEKELTQYCNNKATLCVNSATIGLELILRWFGISDGDEVIVPAYTYCASANVIRHCGAKVILAECNKDFTISVDDVRQKITSKTKAIIAVDIAGLPSYYDGLNQLVKAHEIKCQFIPKTENQELLGRILVMSDSAHSLGAKYRNKKAGSFTDISVFSFHAVKNLTTAEGGAIALNLPEPFDNRKVYNYLNTFSLHGQSKDALAKTKIGNWRYDVIEPGYKGNMTDIQASLGLIALKNYDQTLEKRKNIFKRYSDELGKYDWAELPTYDDENRESSYHLYLLRIKKITEEQRDAIIDKIFAKKVSVNVHYLPLPSMTAYKYLSQGKKDFPVSYDNYAREISLPVYEYLDYAKVDIVLNAVISSVREVLDAD